MDKTKYIIIFGFVVAFVVGIMVGGRLAQSSILKETAIGISQGEAMASTQRKCSTSTFWYIILGGHQCTITR